jgi:hypothetical protein
MINKIDIKDYLKQEDLVKKNFLEEMVDTKEGFSGILVFKDGKSRNILFRTKNKVVLRGRTFALENLYKETIFSSSGYIQNLNRSINLFQVGNGGTPLNDPFNPLPVSHDDENLKNKLAFRKTLVSATQDVINPVNEDIYKGYEIDSLTGSKSYYYKRFENQNPVFIFDKKNNLIYKKLELFVSVDDCRNTEINEVGLFFSSINFTQPEMYSRSVFPTYPIRTFDTLLIEYYTYC